VDATAGYAIRGGTRDQHPEMKTRRTSMRKIETLLLAAIIASFAFEAFAQARYANYNVPTEQQGWYDRNARY
jgi:hypothetical protein